MEIILLRDVIVSSEIVLSGNQLVEFTMAMRFRMIRVFLDLLGYVLLKMRTCLVHFRH